MEQLRGRQFDTSSAPPTSSCSITVAATDNSEGDPATQETKQVNELISKSESFVKGVVFSAARMP
jgi:hypothetical protein